MHNAGLASRAFRFTSEFPIFSFSGRCGRARRKAKQTRAYERASRKLLSEARFTHGVRISSHFRPSSSHTHNNTPHERDEDAMLNNALTIHPPCQLWTRNNEKQRDKTREIERIQHKTRRSTCAGVELTQEEGSWHTWHEARWKFHTTLWQWESRKTWKLENATEQMLGNDYSNHGRKEHC